MNLLLVLHRVYLAEVYLQVQWTATQPMWSTMTLQGKIIISGSKNPPKKRIQCKFCLNWFGASSSTIFRKHLLASNVGVSEVIKLLALKE